MKKAFIIANVFNANICTQLHTESPQQSHPSSSRLLTVITWVNLLYIPSALFYFSLFVVLPPPTPIPPLSLSYNINGERNDSQRAVGLICQSARVYIRIDVCTTRPSLVYFCLTFALSLVYVYIPLNLSLSFPSSAHTHTTHCDFVCVCVCA